MSSSKYYKIRFPGSGSHISDPKHIPGYENYLADSRGRIYVSNRYGRLRQLTQFLTPNSRYLRVYLTKNRTKKNFYVHNLVISAFRKYDPERIKVKHIDRNCFNNRLGNLKLDGASDYCEKSRIEEYKIECLEESLKEKTGFRADNGLWKSYERIKKVSTPKTVINWLVIVLKSL